MPFPHSLACPHAGQWHLLFSFLAYFFFVVFKSASQFFPQKSKQNPSGANT
jgi:hypothetical protein